MAFAPLDAASLLEVSDSETEAHRAPSLPNTVVLRKAKLGWFRRWMDKGTVSTLVLVALSLIGWLLIHFKVPLIGPYLFSFGMFGLAGGLTNALAIKMLFDRIPFVYGSGVIPAKFEEIRANLKQIMMALFFDKDYLEGYILRKLGKLSGSLHLEARAQQLFQSPEVEALINEKLAELAERPEGLFLSMMNIPLGSLKSLVLPFVLSLSADLAPTLLRIAEPGNLYTVDAIHAEIDTALTAKLSLLTPLQVKQVLEDVIRDHLAWLVVWGNIFGGVLGVLSHFMGVSDLLSQIQ
eukprot:TRINITY_DN5942_c0_g1_i1.p1 TRINITY_DN5942_c0_g1~~TRINITY_DN5942_c0_g1_i1.p1  ORF type:complete len:301 (-),score=54.37 TRINITY_DN5942_c0_g1_i1:31-912(-)